MGDGHSHNEEGQSTRKLAIVAGINLTGFVAELAGGLLFGSVALIGDALHMLFDAVAYVLALGAVYVGRRTEPGSRWSYGLNRLEPLAAFLNGVLLVPMVGYLVWESYQRYLQPVEIEPLQTAALATGGLVLNIVSVYVIQGGSMSLNERGAYYHLLGDTGASVAVIVSMLVIQFTGSKLADPVTAVIIAVIIVWSAVDLIRESGAIFLQRSPVSVEDVRQRLLDVGGVASVEDAHVWELSSSLRIATVHVRDHATTVAERDALNERISSILASEYDADHVTVDLVSAGNDTDRRREH
jgi:cobalt-zinc-cadmium efflux system protein